MMADFKSVEKIRDLAIAEGAVVNRYEGALLDNFVIDGARCIRVNNIVPRKYIIIREEYLNEWSSTYSLVFTDSDGVCDEFKKGWS